MRDTATPLFTRLFLVRTPNLATLDEDYVRKYGVPVTGIDSIDKSWAEELVWRYLSIDKMVELYRRGVDIYVQDRKDTKVIYNLIYDHLQNFSQYIGSSINVNEAPMEDLEDLAKLASLLYPYAKSQPEFQQVQKNLYMKQISGHADEEKKLNPVLGDARSLFRSKTRSQEKQEKQALLERMQRGEEIEEQEAPHDKFLDNIQKNGFSFRRKGWN